MEGLKEMGAFGLQVPADLGGVGLTNTQVGTKTSAQSHRSMISFMFCVAHMVLYNCFVFYVLVSLFIMTFCPIEYHLLSHIYPVVLFSVWFMVCTVYTCIGFLYEEFSYSDMFEGLSYSHLNKNRLSHFFGKNLFSFII